MRLILLLLLITGTAFATYNDKWNNTVFDNLLSDPNFTNPSLSAWTQVSGTRSQTRVASEVTEVGGSAMKIVSTAGNLFEVNQLVTLAPGAPRQNIVGFNYRIPSGCTGATISIYVDGSSTAQSAVNGNKLIFDNTYRPLEIPTVVSNGSPSIKLEFKAAASCLSQTLFISKAYVKAGIGTQALQLDNVYSAQVSITSSSVCTVDAQSKTWIASTTANGTGDCTLNLTSGIFTNANYACSAMAITHGDASTEAVKFVSRSTSALRVNFNKNLSSPGIIDNGVFTIICQKSGNDYLVASAAVYSQANSAIEKAGTIIPTAGASCGAGHLLADGAAVSRTTYSQLYTEIGTTYGVGDGSTTFNLPNLKGVFLKGAGSQTIGGIVHTGTLGTTENDQMQGHKHTNEHGTNGGSNGTVVASTLRLPGINFVDVQGGVNNNSIAISNPITDGTNGTPRTGTVTRPANVAVNYCIRTTTGSTIVGSFAQKTPTIQKFTSGSNTYTTPAGVSYIKVRMVGGGGGGAGSGTTAGTPATSGTASTFGTALLSAGGGLAGAQNSIGAGGTSSLGSAIGTVLSGANGNPNNIQQNGGIVAPALAGAAGGSSAFGGAGQGGVSSSASAGGAGISNTGGGGGGGSLTASTINGTGGSGGGAGGYIDAIITAPMTTYTYTVGAAGTAGGAGTSGAVGGAGGSGYVEVTEYYNIGTM
jgi:hypothetical protein